MRNSLVAFTGVVHCTVSRPVCTLHSSCSNLVKL
jgi:hypothetical protein